MQTKTMLLWLGSLVVVALLASTLTAAQVLRGVQPLPTPEVVSGDDLGFRVEGLMTDETGTPSGRLVIRVNGEWVDVVLQGGQTVRPLR
jgi:hypothetical protein